MARVGAWITSAESVGVVSTADWARWIDRGRAPHSGEGNGFDASWRDDLEMLASFGVTELAVTAEWARLAPGPREHDHLEIERFRLLMEAVVEFGMAPWVCLVDGTLPGWFVDDEGGFDDDRARSLLWPAHVDFVGELVGDLAAGWIPQREPIRRVLRSHVLGLAPPGQARALADTSNAVANVLRAESDAWRLLRGTSPVAASVTGRRFVPDQDDVRARPHAEWLDEVSWAAFERVLTDGELTVAGLPSSTVDSLRDAYDVVIVHPRPPVLVDGDGGWSPLHADRAEPMAEAVDRASALAGTRRLIACGDLVNATTSDDPQEQADHLQAVIEAAGSGGATDWWQSSPIDSWGWENGFDVVNGVVDRDRRPRRAADLLRRLAQA